MAGNVTDDSPFLALRLTALGLGGVNGPAAVFAPNQLSSEIPAFLSLIASHSFSPLLVLSEPPNIKLIVN